MELLRYRGAYCCVLCPSLHACRALLESMPPNMSMALAFAGLLVGDGYISATGSIFATKVREVEQLQYTHSRAIHMCCMNAQ